MANQLTLRQKIILDHLCGPNTSQSSLIGKGSRREKTREKRANQSLLSVSSQTILKCIKNECSFLLTTPPIKEPMATL